jgi:arsenate reductase
LSLKLAIVNVQVFGIQKNQDVRKALRFFSERRIRVHFVDLNERAASQAELRRFAQKFGVSALIDKNSRRYAELGLGAVRYDDAHWLAKLAEEPLILVMPLARFEQRLTIGLAEPEWQSWATMAKP